MTASHSGLRSPGSSPRATTSPPTSTSTSRSHLSAAIACASPSATGAGPSLMSISTRRAARGTRPSATRRRTRRGRAGGCRVRPAGCPARAPSASVISAAARGPGTGSNGRRSQVRPPSTGSAPSYSRTSSAVASAPTTSPPPPMPITSGSPGPAQQQLGVAHPLVLPGDRGPDVYTVSQREVHRIRTTGAEPEPCHRRKRTPIARSR